MKSLYEKFPKEKLVKQCDSMSTAIFFYINTIGDLSEMVIKAFEGCEYKKLTENQRELVNNLVAKGILMVDKVPSRKGVSGVSRYIVKKVKDHYLIEELDKLIDKTIEKRKKNANMG